MTSINQTNNENVELKKEELSERVVQKWLKLQKTIKEEITLEDVIINQQKTDFNHLKDYFKDYYTAILNIRKSFDDIKKLSREDFKNIKTLYIDQNLDNLIPQISEPIKNLLFILRNDYNYISKLISLIDEKDERENIESLVHLFCNQFYDNILIPNPEQTEMLLLIYKLLEDEISPMNTALIELYLSMLLNPFILSIENEAEECLDMSLISIKDFIIKKNKEKKIDKIYNSNSIKENINTTDKIKKEENDEINYEQILFSEIPKSKIKFKKYTELEAELEEENKRKR